MTTFDPTDPAAEIKYLKALERGKTPAWPAMPNDPAKVKKAADWPTPVGKPKKPPRHVAHMMVDPAAPSYRPTAYEGYTIGEVIRAVLIFLAAIGAALLID